MIASVLLELILDGKDVDSDVGEIVDFEGLLYEHVGQLCPLHVQKEGQVAFLGDH